MTSNAPLVNGFDIPTDSTHPLEPNRALAIRLPAPHATHRPSEIHDLTPRLQTLFSTASGITDENLLSAHKASIVSPPPQIRYSLERQNLLGTHLAILDVEGNEIANWKHPILSLGVGSGTTEITFPREGEKPTKIEIKKVVDSKGKEKTGYLHHHHVQNFILDGVRYFWKEEAGVIYQKALFKVSSLILFIPSGGSATLTT
jgi:hypothetical protein